MALANWFILIGGILLLIGLLMAFKSSHTFAQVMGAARQGVAVMAPEPHTPEMQQRERLLKQSDVAFAWGLGLTGTGVVLQTAGSLMAATSSGSVVLGSSRMINILGLVFDAIGAGVIAYPLLIAVPLVDFSTEQAIHDRRRESQCVKIGSIFLAIGFIFQIVANLPA